jgi:hypothetical protein
VRVVVLGGQSGELVVIPRLNAWSKIAFVCAGAIAAVVGDGDARSRLGWRVCHASTSLASKGSLDGSQTSSIARRTRQTGM